MIKNTVLSAWKYVAVGNEPAPSPEPSTAVTLDLRDLRESFESIIPCGYAPAVDPFTWQTDCYNKIAHARLSKLVAPTGGGKTHEMKLLAANRALQGRRAIIVVPQLIIGQRGYGNGVEHLRLPDGQECDWYPQLVLDGKRSSERLMAFVMTPASAALEQRVIVVATPTFNAVCRRMREQGVSLDVAGPLDLFLDEAHQVKYDENVEDPTEQCNQLGLTVAEYIDNPNLGALMLITATPYRGDLLTIVPRGKLALFEAYTRYWDEHLAAMKHLKSIEISYMIGSVEESLKRTYETKDGVYGIVFQRHPVDKDKLGRSARYKEAIGVDDLVDLVDPTSQKRNKALLLERLGRGDPGPKAVLAIDIGKLGLDWPHCNLVVIDQKRGSYADMIQRIGRALRDCLGKSKVRIVIMIDSITGRDTEVLREYLKTLLGSMVLEAQFRPINFKGCTPRQKTAIREVTHDAKVMDDIVDGLHNAELGNHLGQTDEEALNDIVGKALDSFTEDTGRVFDSEEREGVAETVRGNIQRIKKVLCDSRSVTFDPGLSESNFGVLKVLSTSFDASTLRRLRQELNRPLYWPLKAEVNRLGIRSRQAYYDRYTEIPGAPQDPEQERCYPAEWTNWQDFLTPGDSDTAQAVRKNRQERRASEKIKLLEFRESQEIYDDKPRS